MNTLEVKVPDMGDITDVKIIELMVKVGDFVKIDQSIVTVESDKASMEIPSSGSGIVKELKVILGEEINEGDCLLVLEIDIPAAGLIPPTTIHSTPVNELLKTEYEESLDSVVVPIRTSTSHASPSVRKFAREMSIDLRKVTGTGIKGRILRDDIKRYIEGTSPVKNDNSVDGSSARINLLPWPSLDFSKQGPAELLPLSRIKKISGLNLHRNWSMIPHVTQFDEANISELEKFRKQSNEIFSSTKSTIKLTILAFVIKACVEALKKFPEFNSSLDSEGKNLILKYYYNIGFAIDTPSGLLVAVIKNSDAKNISQIAEEIKKLSAQARDGKLKSEDMQGATFTISSLGGIGGTSFTPIINAPEVAILGLSKASMKPFWDDRQFVPRLMMPISLSYDHRAVDGVMAARFSVYLTDILSDIRKILL
jgi:pyruvate dehydrogenase E2 component (dihydrolipoamide acetyltransferase)